MAGCRTVHPCQCSTHMVNAGLRAWTYRLVLCVYMIYMHACRNIFHDLLSFMYYDTVYYSLCTIHRGCILWLGVYPFCHCSNNIGIAGGGPGPMGYDCLGIEQDDKSAGRSGSTPKRLLCVLPTESASIPPCHTTAFSANFVSIS